jgi:hypothetical protein
VEEWVSLRSHVVHVNLEVVGGGLAVKNRVASLVGFLGVVQIRPREGEHLLPTDPILRDKQFPEIFVFKHVHPMVGSSGINFLGDKSESVGPCKPGPVSDMGLINVPITQGVVSPMIESYYQPVAIMKKEELAMVGSAVKKNPKWKRKKRSGVNISVDNSVNISGNKRMGNVADEEGMGKKGRVAVGESRSSKAAADDQPRLAQ